jgi:hypothetical protein
MAAKASRPMTRRFWRTGIWRSLTIQNGNRPNVQSAMTLRPEIAKTRAISTVLSRHFPLDGSIDQNVSIGVHWKVKTKNKIGPKSMVSPMTRRMIQIWSLAVATLSKKKPMLTLRSEVVST